LKSCIDRSAEQAQQTDSMTANEGKSGGGSSDHYKMIHSAPSGAAVGSTNEDVDSLGVPYMSADGDFRYEFYRPWGEQEDGFYGHVGPPQLANSGRDFPPDEYFQRITPNSWRVSMAQAALTAALVVVNLSTDFAVAVNCISDSDYKVLPQKMRYAYIASFVTGQLLCLLWCFYTVCPHQGKVHADSGYMRFKTLMAQVALRYLSIPSQMEHVPTRLAPSKIKDPSGNVAVFPFGGHTMAFDLLPERLAGAGGVKNWVWTVTASSKDRYLYDLGSGNLPQIPVTIFQEIICTSLSFYFVAQMGRGVITLSLFASMLTSIMSMVVKLYATASYCGVRSRYRDYLRRKATDPKFGKFQANAKVHLRLEFQEEASSAAQE